MLENDFVKASLFRHACKKFDTSRQIPKEEFDSLLDVARLAPSSMGLEQTRMIVLRDKKKREELKKVCWDQNQITQASEVVIFTSLKCDLLPHSNYTMEKFKKRLKTHEELDLYVNKKYSQLVFQENDLYDDARLSGWVSTQAHIMSTAMAYYAAFLGIDSCFIGGFDKALVEKLLEIDTFQYQVSIILCLGYRVDEQKPKLRMTIDDIVKYI